MSQKKAVEKTWEIPGRSGKPHKVTLYEDGTWWCTCSAFRFQKGPVEQRTCKHVERVRNKVVEAIEAGKDALPPPEEVKPVVRKRREDKWGFRF